MVRICIWMLWIPFEWLEFELECFETLSTGSNFHLNASNPFQMARICIRMLAITFECFPMQIRTVQKIFKAFKCKFEPFERDLKHSNGNSNHSKGIRRIWIQIRTIRMGFEAFECKFDAMNPFRIVRICIWMLRIPFEWLEFAFQRFESLSNG